MLVSGSFLSDKIKPKDAILMFHESSVDFLHVDVMDGKFVKSKSFTISEVEKFSSYTNKKLDIHLMVSNPLKYVDSFSLLNTSYITFHYEAVKDVSEVINHIKNNGIRVGISIKPETSVSSILPFLKDVDLVLIMSVEPGASGQKFLPSVLYKIDVLKREIMEKGYSTIISVDGGVNESNIDVLKEKKVDMVVSSSYLLSGDMESKIRYIKS